MHSMPSANHGGTLATAGHSHREGRTAFRDARRRSALSRPQDGFYYDVYCGGATLASADKDEIEKFFDQARARFARRHGPLRPVPCR